MFALLIFKATFSQAYYKVSFYLLSIIVYLSFLILSIFTNDLNAVLSNAFMPNFIASIAPFAFDGVAPFMEVPSIPKSFKTLSFAAARL